MHTEVIKVEGFDDARIHHNGDWSGNAIIQWTRDGNAFSVTLPGDIIQGIIESALKEVADGIIAALNQHTNTVISEPATPTPPTLNDVLTTFKAK